MENYNFQNETVIDMIPMQANLDEQLMLSSDIRGRRTIEINPPQNTMTISGTSMNNVVQFKIQSASEWLDFMNSNLVYTVSNVAGASGTVQNLTMLDGRYACINRVSVSSGGVELQVSNDNFNRHRNSKYLNECFKTNYESDARILNSGNAKLCPVISSSTVLGATAFYGALESDCANFCTANGETGHTDALGAILPAYAGSTGSFGCFNSFISDKSYQQVSIPLSEICSLASIQKYFPLYLLNDGLQVNIYFSSPQNAFFSDNGNGTTGGFVPSTLTSYKLSNIKMVVDLITASDSLNNSYKMKAMSAEGINLVYDDFQVVSAGQKVFSGLGNQQFQVNVSTTSLKSALIYFSANVDNAQNAWGNSHFPYLGVQGVYINCNNTNYPSVPLNTPLEIMLYNNRSKNVVGNQLSQFLANLPAVFGASEQPTATQVVSSTTAFFVFFNFEKVLGENNMIRNGLDLKSGTSQITVHWNEDPARDGALSNNLDGALGSTGIYTPYILAEFQRLFSIRNGQLEVIG